MAESRYAWLDAQLVPESEARVPVASQALQLGLSVFETMRVCGGAAPLWERHAERLERGARALGFPAPPLAAIPQRVRRLAERNGAREGVVRLTYSADFCALHWRSLPPDLERESREGTALASAIHARELTGVKSGSRAGLHELERRAGQEVALGDGETLLETTRSSLFAWCEGRLWTAPAALVLPGVARAWILERARDRGIALCEAPVPRSLLAVGAELCTSNAVRGIRRVAVLDGFALAPLAPHSPLLRLQRELNALLRGEVPASLP